MRSLTVRLFYVFFSSLFFTLSGLLNYMLGEYRFFANYVLVTHLYICEDCIVTSFPFSPAIFST